MLTTSLRDQGKIEAAESEAARREGISVATALDSFLIERPAHES